MQEQKTTISINGKRISSFEHVHLTQTINEHHDFEIILDQEIIEAQGGHTIDKSKDWLGSVVVITFDTNEFLGIVTNVQLVHNNGHHGKILVSGYSKTILLEAGTHMQSWLKRDLATIIQDTVDTAGVEAVITPKNTALVEYQAQYQETHFEFIKRLAKQYNEWLYYDGLKLIFGKPSTQKTVKLEYGREIKNLSISIQTIPHKLNNFTYNSLDDTKNEAKTKDDVSGLTELGLHAFNVSKDIYKITPNTFSSVRIKDKSELDQALKNKQYEASANTNILTGDSNKQGLALGDIIKVSSAKYDDNSFDIKNYGEYIIIEITHQKSNNTEYSNSFKAISGGVEVLPTPTVSMPVAQTQIATVVSNDDPKKKGRVQVLFQWQSGTMKSSWLRVMSPDAGKSDLVGTNRGFVYIPEVGDTVMVGFRYNDPNRPFVMGSMFNGTTGAGGNDKNKIKSITTRSGSTITFDDNEGKGKITISDPSGNVVTLNGDETITISAPKSITLNSKEITLNAEDKITLKGDNNVEINSKDILAKAETKLELQSEANMIMSSKSKEEKHTKYDLKAEATVDIEGSKITNVKGGMVNLN